MKKQICVIDGQGGGIGSTVIKYIRAMFGERIVKDNEKILLMESVDKVAQESNGNWLLVSIFGEQKRIKRQINGMNLVHHEIIFEEMDD